MICVTLELAGGSGGGSGNNDNYGTKNTFAQAFSEALLGS